MTRLARNRLAKVLAGMLIAGLTATWAIGEVLVKNETARRDKHEVARMTEKMKTVCVGRFLIDMPADAAVEFAGPRIQGFDIAAFDETPEAYAARLVQREAQIRARPDRFGGKHNLELAKDIATDAIAGKIFVHGREVAEGTAANGLAIERYRDEGVAVEGMVHGAGVSIDVGSDYYFPDRIGDLATLVAEVVPNPGNRIPQVPGFCIDRAYVRGLPKGRPDEQITMFARLPRHPDVEFMLILAAGTEPDEESLLARDSAAEERLSIGDRMRIARLRAGPRTIATLAGEEVVRRAVEENDAQGYSFWWEVNGTPDQALVPHVVFKMNTGKGEQGPVPSSLSEGAALLLWDAISSSIRVRPAEPEKMAQADPAPVPLGIQAEAGERCPHSGWWLCSDGGNGVDVLGGQRQYLRKGEKMPQALLLPKQTLWQKLRGLQASYESRTRTAWQLVDKRERGRAPSAVPLAQASIVARAGSIDGGDAVRAEVRPEAPIGCVAKTGVPCPASGWWRCDEAQALDGTRWFAAGASLPPATFGVPPAAFGRAFGQTRTIQRRSVWKLMRHAGAADGAVASSAGAMPAPPVPRDAPPSSA